MQVKLVPITIEEWASLEAHPAANVFPMMLGADYEELLGNIQKRGFDANHPIVIHEGKMLDGRNRHKVCVSLQQKGMLHSQPVFAEWKGSGSVVDWVLSENLFRRHLTASQRAAVAVSILPIYEAEAQKRKAAAGGDRKSEKAKSLGAKLHEAIETGRSDAQAASAVGVSPRYVADAKAIKVADEDLFDRVRSGEITLQQAKRIIEDGATEAVGASSRMVRRAKRVNENDPEMFEQVKNGELTLTQADKQVKEDTDDKGTPTDERLGSTPLSDGYGRPDSVLLPRHMPDAARVIADFYTVADTVSLIEHLFHYIGIKAVSYLAIACGRWIENLKKGNSDA